MSEQRIALVTGAAGGIGLAICQGLAAQGLRIVAVDLALPPLTALVASLPGQGHRAMTVDLRQEASIDALYAELAAEGLTVSVLVNTAAISPIGAAGERLDIRATTPQMWQEVFAVNAFGTYAMCRGFVLQAGEGLAQGRIVNFASTAAQLGGYQSATAYVASKGAVIAFTKVLARDVAALGVTANVVSPGLVNTPMLRCRLAPEDDSRAVGLVPLARVGQPDEVAAAVSYLVSPLAAYVTGSTLDVNGGYYMN